MNKVGVLQLCGHCKRRARDCRCEILQQTGPPLLNYVTTKSVAERLRSINVTLCGCSICGKWKKAIKQLAKLYEDAK